MLKEQAKFLGRLVCTFDVAVIVFAFIQAFLLQVPYDVRDFYQLSHYLWFLLVIIPTWLLLMHHHGMYRSLRISTLSEIVTTLLKIQAIGGVITAAFVYFVESHGLNRGLIGYFLAISFVLLAAEKIGLKFILSQIRKQGYNFRNIIIVGTDRKAEEFVNMVANHADWGLKIIGLVRLNGDQRESVGGQKIIGHISELTELCKMAPIDEVVFCVPPESLPDLENYVLDLEEMGVTTRMVLDFYELRRSKRELSLFHGQVPIMTFYSRSFDATHLFLKRCLDIVGATVGLCLSSFFFPFIALAIKLDSPGPLFFGQKRVGENGRIFTCWKYRSMYIDAEERKQELMHLNEMKGAIFKIKNDPRITRVGNFLRKTSLDELPQFWNVLSGEMSLVGTRPPTVNEVAGYENWHRKRICIKPGITGMWQVSGRNQISDFDEVARLDIEYIEKWSFGLDLKILFKTVLVVFARSGS